MENPTIIQIMDTGATVEESVCVPGIISVDIELNGFHFSGQYSDTEEGVYAIEAHNLEFLQLLDILAQHPEEEEEVKE